MPSELSPAASPDIAIEQESESVMDPAVLGTDAAGISKDPSPSP